MAESINGRQREAGTDSFSFKDIIKGDDPRIAAFLRRQIPFILYVIALILVYIGNRYDSQCDLVRIEQLKKELTDVRYQALNITSDVSAKSKPSYIEKAASDGQSGLRASVKPPYDLRKKSK